MKMTPKRLQILKLLYEIHLNRKGFYDYKGVSAYELSKFMKSKGYLVSKESVATFLHALSLLDLAKNNEGISGSWMISSEGEAYLKGLEGAQK